MTLPGELPKNPVPFDSAVRIVNSSLVWISKLSADPKIPEARNKYRYL